MKFQKSNMSLRTSVLLIIISACPLDPSIEASIHNFNSLEYTHLFGKKTDLPLKCSRKASKVCKSILLLCLF